MDQRNVRPDRRCPLVLAWWMGRAFKYKQVVDGIPGKNTLAGCPTCRRGARGNITRLIQERLNSLGFNCGKVDGIFGAGTENAVKALQKVHGLVQDGIVGQKTWRILLRM